MQHKFLLLSLLSLSFDNALCQPNKVDENGLKHGEWICHNKNGSLRKKENYQNGVLYGELVTLDGKGKNASAASSALNKASGESNQQSGNWISNLHINK
jgi:antitoxin component YwqK of YwqJK toxin-antitoxin module